MEVPEKGYVCPYCGVHFVTKEELEAKRKAAREECAAMEKEKQKSEKESKKKDKGFCLAIMIAGIVGILAAIKIWCMLPHYGSTSEGMPFLLSVGGGAVAGVIVFFALLTVVICWL
jgi:uncharacterized membrane protein